MSLPVPVSNVITSLGKEYGKAKHGKELTWKSEQQFAISLINKSWQIQKATPESIKIALISAGSMGLSLNPIKQHVYLIPRRERKQWKDETDQAYKKVPYIVTASPSYRGLTHLAINTGGVVWIRADVVFSGDKFKYFGPGKAPEYEMGDGYRTEQNATGVYAIARLSNGDTLCEYMDKGAVLEVKNRSELKTGLMWTKFFSEAYKKAVIRRLCKTLPNLPDVLINAFAVMDESENIKFDEEGSIDGEAVETLTDDECNALHAVLVDAGIDNPDSWLSHLAAKYSVPNYKEIPRQYFDFAKQFLVMAIENRKNKEAGNDKSE